ncbi:MAG TPA: prepilin-type N-terminal cleavage/methylation domain-containing protein [Myxococcota bacterium]|nr:prepilin-type N-terminal cleavage/methylation domain-containing protein [Myxococcota bacterium]
MVRNARAGMTLVELMIALVLVGVMLTMGISTLGEWADQQRAATSARSVADAISLARAEAIRTGSNHIVAFDITSGLDGRTDDIVIVNDGPLGSTAGVSSNCRIAASEITYHVALERGVRFGTTQSSGGAPNDPGSAAEAATGTTFKDAAGAAASWVMFGADGMPRRFTQNGSTTPPCTAVGPAAQAAAAIYVSNDSRDYAIVMTPLGTARVHRYRSSGAGSWTP